jgi:hypothetical protein
MKLNEQAKSRKKKIKHDLVSKKGYFSQTTNSLQISIIGKNHWIGREALIIQEGDQYPFSVVTNSRVIVYEISVDELVQKLPKDVVHILKKMEIKTQRFLSDRIMSICKSVNEVSKWDNYYSEYKERISEVSKQFSQASRSAVTNLENIPIISEITTGVISRFQNKLAEKSPNFKRILHSRSQSHFGFSTAKSPEPEETQFLLSRNSKRINTSKSMISEGRESNSSISSNNASPNQGSPEQRRRIEENKICLRSSLNNKFEIHLTQVVSDKPHALYRNLSLPHILEQQKRIAQIEKIIVESRNNPRFKEKINLPTLTKRTFLAKDIIEKFKNDEARCKCSNTFRYKRKSYDESIVLNSSPAAYWPFQEDSGRMLMPTMKYNRINEKKTIKNGSVAQTIRKRITSKLL